MIKFQDLNHTPDVFERVQLEYGEHPTAYTMNRTARYLKVFLICFYFKYFI